MRYPRRPSHPVCVLLGLCESSLDFTVSDRIIAVVKNTVASVLSAVEANANTARNSTSHVMSSLTRGSGSSLLSALSTVYTQELRNNLKTNFSTWRGADALTTVELVGRVLSSVAGGDAASMGAPIAFSTPVISVRWRKNSMDIRTCVSPESWDDCFLLVLLCRARCTVRGTVMSPEASARPARSVTSPRL